MCAHARAQTQPVALRHTAGRMRRCNGAWSLNYHKIMVRYESSLIGMFTGHSHDDEYEIFYRDEARTSAATVNYIGPSATPYTNSNPGFRIYEVCGRKRAGRMKHSAAGWGPKVWIRARIGMATHDLY